MTGPVPSSSPKRKGQRRQHPTDPTKVLVRYTLNAEGIADSKVLGIIADEYMKNSKMCLFRIETPSVGTDAGETKLEKKANKVSFLKSQGATLKYGQEVMLRHVHSNRFLSLDLLLASQTPGAWSVTVNDPKESLCRQISLQPFNRSHNIGDPIKFRDPVSIVFLTENLKYFLQSEVMKPEMIDVNSTHKPAGWRFYLFEGHDASSDVLKFGETVTIKYTKMSMFMALQKEKPRKKRERNVSNSAVLQAALRKLPGMGEEVIRAPIVTKAEVEDFSHYWIVQNDNAMMGGAVTWKSRFFIKNALTGQVLGPNLVMQSNPDPAYAFFFPKPDSFKEDSLIPNRYPLLLKTKDEKVLAPDSKKSSEEALDHLVPIIGNESQWESGEVGLTLEVLGQDQRESLFEFDYVSERESIFFNLINSLYPKFVEIKEKLEQFKTPLDQTTMSAWEATELLENTLKTMLNALTNISKYVRSAQGDEQEALQKIFAGLGFHAILIEIAFILHTLFDCGEKLDIANEVIETNARKNLEEIWNLLNDVALENEVAAKKIAEHQAFLCELLKYDTERIGSLLNEVFRLVDPEIKDPKQFYHQWCSRLENLTSQNIQEQTIFMRIIRNLCEIGDVGLLEYQNEIARHLFDSDIAIDLVIFGNWKGDVSVKFGGKQGKTRTYEEFKAANSRLDTALTQDFDGQGIILLQDLNAFDEYVEYVQTALMLYHSICKGRCELARNFVKSRLGISVETAIDVSQTMSAHIDIRRSFIFLLEALCITVPPFEQYNEQDTSFAYADIKMMEGTPPSRQPLFNSALTNTPILKSLKIIFEFWMVKKLPLAISRQNRSSQLHYLMAMLRLTMAVVEFKHCPEMFALLVLRTIQYLLVGFTGAAEQYKNHWAAEIIMISVKEGTKNRKIKLIVNELLGAVLGTILAIKKSGRRLILMQILSKFINDSKHFSNPLFVTGLVDQSDHSRVINEIRECVDSEREEKLLNDFIRRAERSKSRTPKTTISTPLLTRSNTMATDDYLGKFDFKDIVANAPPLKEIFIRVMLEWSSFSNFLKNKMIDVMNEIFQERRLFDKFMKTSDVISLGQISVISNRLRWLKENSELSSLFVRAKYESLISGQSQSLATIVCSLEYLINFLHPRNGNCDFVIKKTQNIVRQLRIFKEVMMMWSLVHYLGKLGKGDDTPCIRLKSALVTFLLYFVRRNAENSRELSKYLEPSHYVMTVQQYPSFLRQLNNFAHLAIRDVTRLLVHILNQVHQSDKHLTSMCFFEKLMIDKDHTLKRTTQNIASTLLSEKLSESLGKIHDRPLYIASLIENLALSAEDNTPVITQCRHLLSFSHLQEMMQTESNLTLLSALCYFLYAVYVKKGQLVGSLQTLETIVDICDIVTKIIDIASENMREPVDILKLALNGSYSLIYFTRNPAYTEIQINLSHHLQTSELVNWTFLCKESDGRESGVLKYVLDILEIVELDESVKEPLCKLYRAVSECIGKMEAMRLQTVDLLSFNAILRVFEKTRARLRILLEKVGEEEILFEPIERVTYPIPEKLIRDLQTVLAGSIPYSTDTGEADSLEVDVLMAKVMKTGYQQFTKIFEIESEDGYISSIVQLIDPRLFIGNKLTKKEVKDLILALRSKIRPLQKLFTTSAQRAIFFKILEGIVPNEDMAGFKILLNPLFLDIDVVGQALTAILRHESNGEVLAALSLLRKLFILQSREFMDAFRLSLNENAWAYPLFMKIQNELIKSKSYIFEKVTQEKSIVPNTQTTNVDSFADKMTKSRTGEEIDTEKAHEIVIKMLNFIQICCDNCNEPFQIFYRTQMNTEGKADVDMVTVVANFLIDIRSAGDILFTNPSIYDMLNASLEVLVDFVTGPCLTNQLLLGNNVRIYLVMNSLIAQSQGRLEEEYATVHLNCINFLCTLLEGHPDPTVPETMSKFLNVEMLRLGCEDVYQRYIKGHEEDLSLELESLGEDYITIVENSIQQAILIIKMKAAGVTHEEINKFEANEKDPRFSYGFYEKYIGYVEVDRNGILESHFFRIPWKCKYLTQSTRNHILVSVNRSSHQEKIKDFLAKVPLCKLEMKHQQTLWCSKTFKAFSMRWGAFGRYSYYIALWINVVLLCSIEKPDFSDLKGNFWAFTAVAILGIIQIGCYMASFFFNLVEYYPQALAASIPKPKEFEMEDFPVVLHSDSQMMLGLHSTLTTNSRPDYGTELQLKLKQSLFNFELYYTYVYFLLSIIAVYEPVFYSFLLLDMIKQTPELVNVLRSVTQNFRQLILTMWLGVILIYLFTIGAFVYFSSYFNPRDGLFCNDLWGCFWTTLNRGIRDNGDFLENPSFEHYWSRMMFDMMFYLIIIIILLNIIFGIIIDTFAELRDQRTQVLNDIHNKCFICGNDRSVIELKSAKLGGWSYHFMREHSLFSYLSFMIYLDEKKIYDCSGLEKHCKECFAKKDTTFMPKTSLQMEKGDEDMEIKAGED